MVWAPEIMLDDRPFTAGDSAVNLEVGVALCTAVLLLEDMNRMAELHEYEDLPFMMQHSVLVIQHPHSYATKTEMMRKDLAKKTIETTKLLTFLNKAEASNRALMDKAKDAKIAQSLAEEKAKATDNEAEAAKAELAAIKAKVADLEAKLQEAIANKEAEVKAADEKAFEEGQAAVREQYREQVNLGSNRGYYFGWMAALNKMDVAMDFDLRDISKLQVPFPPENKEADVDDEDDDEKAEADEEDVEAATDNKSRILNEQIDLTQDEEDDLASKGVSPTPTTSEAKVCCAEKSLDETLQEIDAELEAERTATLPSDQAKSST
ncbi:KNR4/SMI1 homolog [Camellia sinensis]|uniref:KNR4/SMI1 homolog n=1 Tax=Camellia sinensis TaxID=4442 RepID=UPI0010362EC2|nr:KNR4/SMI1 homolog [Camellia sinensis]